MERPTWLGIARSNLVVLSLVVESELRRCVPGHHNRPAQYGRTPRQAGYREQPKNLDPACVPCFAVRGTIGELHFGHFGGEFSAAATLGLGWSGEIAPVGTPRTSSIMRQRSGPSMSSSG